MSDPLKYTVGWICALATEYVAALNFLDEEHERPEYVSTNDNNDYTLGRICKHNVVIAVLPEGEYGISSAASVAKDMLHSFPNVRIGLMVGIGGGAPSPKHDIRLGDIVVSTPPGRNGGVLQYDFGKTIQNQSFQSTGFLNQSPTLLRTAVSGLKAQYESDGNQLEEAVNGVLMKKPRLVKKYKRPNPGTDRLYRSEVAHPPNGEACVVICGDDSSKLIQRPERDEMDDNPAVHYGLIASANTLMKDATVRDKLVAEKDVMCFEMEAAGLMNHFPCLVIRGICDYSDSHKNKEWQGYAAMTAAAYTKDLLYRIPSTRVAAEKKIAEVLSSG
jgi:nucleoside phosphorylase